MNKMDKVNGIQPYRYVLLLFIAASVCLFTGCGTEENALIRDYHVTAPASLTGTGIHDGDYAVSYLSDGLCVIPKNGQSKPQDSVMRAKASLLINDTDQNMVYSHNIYEKIYPASLTKLVTAYVTLKYANLDDVVKVSYNASHITERGAQLCGFQQGDQIVLRKLLYSFLVYSGNDAGVAIAEHVGGSVEKFAGMMNAEMKRLGSVHSHFVNPHGLHHVKHYTTAYDLYLVFHQLIKNNTFLDIIHRSHYTARFKGSDNKPKTLSFNSTDRYLRGTAAAPKGVTVVGGKTGTTYMAGSCLILFTKSPSGKNFISVVLKAAGSYDLYNQMTHLMAMEK